MLSPHKRSRAYPAARRSRASFDVGVLILISLALEKDAGRARLIQDPPLPEFSARAEISQAESIRPEAQISLGLVEIFADMTARLHRTNEKRAVIDRAFYVCVACQPQIVGLRFSSRSRELLLVDGESPIRFPYWEHDVARGRHGAEQNLSAPPLQGGIG